MRLVLAVLALSIAAAAQGTTVNSPVTVTAGNGSPTFSQDLTPATTAFPCLTLVQSPSTIPGAYRICGQNNAITVDFGKGYVSMQGATGPQGPSGPAGATGQQGAPGPPGPTWKTCTATITNFAFSGGTATGTLTVSGCQ